MLKKQRNRIHKQLKNKRKSAPGVFGGATGLGFDPEYSYSCMNVDYGQVGYPTKMVSGPVT